MHKINLNISVSNVISFYNVATVTQKAEGLKWYSEAFKIAVQLSTLYNDRVRRNRAGEFMSAVSTDSFTGIISALTPNRSWSETLRVAENIAIGNPYSIMHEQQSQVDSILAGSLPTFVLHGLKTRAFYGCIGDPESTVDVCIDRHALSVALGRTATAQERSLLFRANDVYEAVQQIYREASAVLGLRPMQVQAITWLAWIAHFEYARTTHTLAELVAI